MTADQNGRRVSSETFAYSNYQKNRGYAGIEFADEDARRHTYTPPRGSDTSEKNDTLTNFAIFHLYTPLVFTCTCSRSCIHRSPSMRSYYPESPSHVGCPFRRGNSNVHVPSFRLAHDSASHRNIQVMDYGGLGNVQFSQDTGTFLPAS
jgi:hypothetical protein